ncbi:MAG: glycine cleavage system protein GcvH [Streptosporangiales bacterium]|nr:glycine cleavage system protein GcvH [Streptosporangiales bacterium]
MKYTAEHEWVRRADRPGVVRVGITQYAQEQLGDVVYVSLPEPGAAVTAGDPFGEVESTKSVSDLFAPVSGSVVARNDALDTQPDLVNSDPYGDGWMVEIEAPDSEGLAAALDGLMDADAYAASVSAP